MKKIFMLTSVFSLFAFANNVFAQCTLNGEVVPCDEMPTGLFVFMGIFWVIFFVIMVVGFVFWIMMFIDAMKNEKDDLVMWILVFLLTGYIGAIIYYFARKRKRQIKLSEKNNSNETLNK